MSNETQTAVTKSEAWTMNTRQTFQLFFVLQTMPHVLGENKSLLPEFYSLWAEFTKLKTAFYAGPFNPDALEKANLRTAEILPQMRSLYDSLSVYFTHPQIEASTEFWLSEEHKDNCDRIHEKWEEK